MAAGREWLLRLGLQRWGGVTWKIWARAVWAPKRLQLSAVSAQRATERVSLLNIFRGLGALPPSLYARLRFCRAGRLGGGGASLTLPSARGGSRRQRRCPGARPGPGPGPGSGPGGAARGVPPFPGLCRPRAAAAGIRGRGPVTAAVRMRGAFRRPLRPAGAPAPAPARPRSAAPAAPAALRHRMGGSYPEGLGSYSRAACASALRSQQAMRRRPEMTQLQPRSYLCISLLPRDHDS